MVFEEEDCTGGLAAEIHLPVQGPWVQPLVWEDPACRAAAGHALEPVLRSESRHDA